MAVFYSGEMYPAIDRVLIDNVKKQNWEERKKAKKKRKKKKKINKYENIKQMIELD